MITIKVITENLEYCGFQGQLQTEIITTSQEQNTYIIISYILW